MPKTKKTLKQKFNTWLDEPDSYADKLHKEKMLKKHGIKINMVCNCLTIKKYSEDDYICLSCSKTYKVKEIKKGAQDD